MAASEEESEWYQGICFSVNIFIVKQSMLLTFLRLLRRIVSSSDRKHKKRNYRIYPKIFYEVDYGPLAWFWENFGANQNKPFHTQHYGIWHIGNKRLYESSAKKSFQYQIAEICCHYDFWVEALAWRKSGCNKLIKTRKFHIRRNNNKVDSIETGFIVIVHLLP